MAKNTNRMMAIPATLAALFLVFSPSPASAFPDTIIGRWFVSGTPATGLCSAGLVARELNGEDGLLLLVRDRTSYAIRVAFPNSSEPDNFAYVRGRVSIDGRVYGLEGYYSALRRAYAATPNVTLLFSPQIRDHLPGSQLLTIYVGDKLLSFPADGVGEALTVLDQCFEDGAVGSVDLTLALQVSIVREAAVQAAARAPGVTEDCERLGMGLGSPNFADCRMMIWDERRTASTRTTQNANRQNRARALMSLGAAILEAQSPQLPPSRTTIYHLNGRVVQCTETGSVVNCR